MRCFEEPEMCWHRAKRGNATLHALPRVLHGPARCGYPEHWPSTGLGAPGHTRTHGRLFCWDRLSALRGERPQGCVQCKSGAGGFPPAKGRAGRSLQGNVLQSPTKRSRGVCSCSDLCSEDVIVVTL